MKAKKLFWGLVIVAVVAVFGGRAWYLHKQAEQNKDAVKVGLLTFDTGLYAEFGQALDKGAMLAVEEFNQNSPKTQFRLIIEDGKGQAKDAINAFNRLQAQTPDVLIIAGENQVPPVAPLLKNTPAVLTSVTTLDFLKNNQNHLMFLINPSANSVGYTMGKYAKDKLNLTKVAILSLNSNYGKESAEGFIKGLGNQPIIWEQFKDATLTTRDQIMKILATNPDGVYVVGHGPGYPNAFKHLKEQKYNGIIMSDYTVADEDLIDGSGIYFSAMDDTYLGDKIDTFAKKYSKRFGEKISEHSKLGYDAVRIIQMAVQNSGTTSSEIKKGLADLQDVDTFFGKMKFEKDGTSVFPMVIKQMQPDGTAKVIKE